jgi:hypothetical protein
VLVLAILLRLLRRLRAGPRRAPRPSIATSLP